MADPVTAIPTPLSDLDRERFERQGFVVVRELATTAAVARMRRVIEGALAPVLGPAEFEADVHYPGAPANRAAPGGETPRRLLHAITRDAVFRDFATSPAIAGCVDALLDGPARLAQAHHNCVMTKFPGFSSETLWHQDIRYWSYDRPELVSAWLALGAEHPANGGLRLIPGTHREHLDRGRLDADLFLRPELEENLALIDSAVSVDLAAGDVLFFDAQTFHAAGRNDTDAVKLSLVTTYHREDNHAIPGTRSAGYPSLPLRRS